MSNVISCSQCCPTTTFVPNWVQTTPTPVSPVQPVTPNPVFPSTASLPQCTPLQVIQPTPTTVLVTVSIPTEAIITLPAKALEIKNIKKRLKITQSRFFNSPPAVVGVPTDTPKLFLAGFVRKDIQFSKATSQTSTTVTGTINDFVVDVPWSCVVGLGTALVLPPTRFGAQQEYEFGINTALPAGFATKDRLISGDLSEFNLISNEFLNQLPTVSLVFSQINEMDDALDRVALTGGPFEEGQFTMIQEKMIILVQVLLTFPTVITTTTSDC
ncbi:CsxC family protein [Desulfosporosinus sp. SB140]|uniref:CsxC family protein n=1 Tax=Desulfosporosinus paludis TaxID=3115649 RepID=UPI00389073A3